MKPQIDVNDNQHSDYVEPSHSYEDLNDTSNSNPAIIKRNKKSIETNIHILLLAIVFIVLIFILAFYNKKDDIKNLDEEKMFSSTSETITTYDINTSVLNYDIENNVATIEIEITNNSDNNVYLTGNGIYLASNNNVYCVNTINSTSISKFYGKTIEPKETIKATLTYINIIDEPSSLIFTNINDNEHLSWTNIITIKK